MIDDVSEEEKKQRLYILQDRINQQVLQFSRRILVEGTSRKKSDYSPVFGGRVALIIGMQQSLSAERTTVSADAAKLPWPVALC